MNPPLDFASALTQLKLLTSQTTNFTFTDDELTQALQQSWQDSYVCNKVTDTSLSYVAGTWQYAIPATLTTVTGLRFQRTSTDFPEPIDRSLYNVNTATNSIEFVLNAPIWFDAGQTLLVDGRYKLTTNDLLLTDALINYVLSNAAYVMLRNLYLKRNFVFLRNDTTMGDIINARRDMQADMLRYKQSLQRDFEAA